jgi:PIN domain
MKNCIILDANIWRSNLLLRTPISLALLYGVVQSKSKIAIPDVLGKEIYINTYEAGLEYLNGALKNIRFLTHLYDGSKRAKDYLPDKSKIEQAFPRRIAELGEIILKHEHTFTEMENALHMVLTKLPPNSEKNQQYKDSLLWQAVLSLSEKYMVHFVTMDKGFFKNRKYDQGPADNINEDIERKKNNIKIYYEVESCTEILHVFEKAIDNDSIIQNIFLWAKDYLEEELSRDGYYIKDLKEGKLQSYITSDPDKIAVNFEITCGISGGNNIEKDWASLVSDCIWSGYKKDDSKDDSKESLMEFSGNCLFSIKNNDIHEAEIRWISRPSSWGYSTSGYLSIPGEPRKGPQILGEIDFKKFKF